MDSKNKNRRKGFFLDTEVQKKIIVGFTLVPTLCLAVCLAVVAGYCGLLTEEAMAANAELPSLRPLFLSILGFVVVSAWVTIYQALKHSHRIAGPIIRIKNTLREVAKGNKSIRIRLREGDYLSEIADEINATLDVLEEDEKSLLGKEETFEEIVGEKAVESGAAD